MNRRPWLAVAGAAACLGGSVLGWQRTSTADEVPQPTGSLEASALDGASLFAAKGCAGCHDGPDSRAMVGGPPPLVGAAQWAGTRRQGLSAVEYLTESIREPGAYLAVRGTIAMPYLGLTDAEVAAVVDHLLMD